MMIFKQTDHLKSKRSRILVELPLKTLRSIKVYNTTTICPFSKTWGFSYTNTEEGYARNGTDFARDAYEEIAQFLMLFPDYQLSNQRLLSLSGESYAGKQNVEMKNWRRMKTYRMCYTLGKYVPAIAYKIHIENQNSPKIRVNLKGLASGNGLTDPISQLGYGEVLFHLGLIVAQERSFIAQEEAESEELILQGKLLRSLSGKW